MSILAIYKEENRVADHWSDLLGESAIEDDALFRKITGTLRTEMLKVKELQL